MRPLASRCGQRLLLLLALLAGTGRPAQAQAPWALSLVIDPYPSPYLSDWEANPTISTLTVTNPGAREQAINLYYRVVNQAGQLIASGRSDPQLLEPGATVFTSYVEITGSSSHDQGVEDQMRRTGRLPEGEYTACVVGTDGGGFVLAEECASFSILYPEPPILVGPFDGELVRSPNPAFQWTPAQVPPQFRLQYGFRLVEVLPDQTPQLALEANIPHFQSLDVPTLALPYPVTARPLEAGRRYAWRVQVLDQNGYPAASNNGLSEIATFEYQPAGAPGPEGPLGGGTARLTFFDPATEHPEFWAVLDTASVDRWMDYLESQARAGAIEIPIPLPAAFRSLAGGVAEEDPRKPRGAGPESAARAAVAACEDIEGPLVVGRDLDKRSFGLLFKPALASRASALLGCWGAPEYMLPEPDQEFAILFAIQGSEDGLPRVTLGLKPLVPRAIVGLKLDIGVFVLNLLGDFDLSSADLPAEVQDFYGPYEIPLWGPGTEDFIKAGLAGVTKGWAEQSASAGAGASFEELKKMLALNFYGVVDFSQSRLLDAVVRGLCALPGEVSCLTENKVTLRGFVGSHSSTNRGAELGAGGGAAAGGRAGLTRSDKWAVWASVPTTPPGWEPLASLVTERRLELEIGERDTSTTGAIPLDGSAPTQSRTRIILRDVLTGFDALKPALGLADEEELSFFGELSAEITGAGVDTSFTFTRQRSETMLGPEDNPTGTRQRAGADAGAGDTLPDRDAPTRAGPDSTVVLTNDSTSAWSRTQLSLAWGLYGTFKLLGGPIKLHDPTLRLRRADQVEAGQTALGVNIGAGWGVASAENLGTLEIDIDPRTSRVRRDRANAIGGPSESPTTRSGTETRRRLRFKVTARFSEDAVVDQLVSFLWGLVPPP